MPRLGHLAKRHFRPGVCHALDRQGRHRSAVDHLGEFAQERWDKCLVGLGRLAKVELVERGVGAMLPRLLRGEDAALAHLNEPAARSECPEACRDEIAVQGVQDHVDAAATGFDQQGIGKRQRARTHHRRCPKRTDMVALCLATRRRVDPSAPGEGKVHGSRTEPASSGVDEYCLPGLQGSEPVQRIKRRQVTDRQARRLGEVEVFRLAGNVAGGDCHEGAGLARAERDHLIAGGERALGASSGNNACAFAAEPAPGPRQHPQRVQHVTKIQAGGTDFDLHLVRLRGNALFRDEA